MKEMEEELERRGYVWAQLPDRSSGWEKPQQEN